MIGKFVSVREAAEIIGCSEGLVRQMAIAGELAGEKFNGRAWAIVKAAAERVAKNPNERGRPRGNGHK